MSLWRTILLAVNLVGVRFAGAAIGLASQILLARLLTQNDVGVVFMGMSAAGFISLLITGGYQILAVTCLPRYYALGRNNLVRAFHAAFLHDSLWISLGTFALPQLSISGCHLTTASRQHCCSAVFQPPQQRSFA